MHINCTLSIYFIKIIILSGIANYFISLKNHTHCHTFFLFSGTIYFFIFLRSVYTFISLFLTFLSFLLFFIHFSFRKNHPFLFSGIAYACSVVAMLAVSISDISRFLMLPAFHTSGTNHECIVHNSLLANR